MEYDTFLNEITQNFFNLLAIPLIIKCSLSKTADICSNMHTSARSSSFQISDHIFPSNFVGGYNWPLEIWDEKFRTKGLPYIV